MSNRPEGLSPCYFSLATPDIPASHQFRWSWDGTQTSATIKVYASNKTTLLKTYSVSGSTQVVDIGSIGYSFVPGTTYYWTVQTQNSDVSVKAKFKYDNAPKNPKITWAANFPQKGEVIKKSAKFDEIKSNLDSLLDNYSGVTSTIRNRVNGLFNGNIVPSKKDFNALQEVIEFIGSKEGIQYKTTTINTGTTRYEVVLEPAPKRKYDIPSPGFEVFSLASNPEPAPKNLDVIEWVSDSLGASDINKVIAYIDYLTTIPPKPVNKISFSLADSNMYQMNSVSVSSDGKEDPTVDVSWSAQGMSDTSSKILFEEMSTSSDIWFYEGKFSYGPNGKHSSRIFFKPEDIIDISGEPERLFETNWDGLFNEDNLSSALLKFEMVVVDNYENVSLPKTVTKTFSSNLKVPIGIDYYVLEVQRTDLGSTNYSTSGKWYQKYKGSKSSSTYTISSEDGKLWHRVKVVDKSGLESDWKYASGSILFDPLQKPDKPSKFWAANISLNQIGLYWKPVANADEYQVYKWITPGSQIYRGTNSTGGCWATGLSEGTSYNFYVRAGNKKGWSDWVSLTASTKKQPIVEKTWTADYSESYNYKYGWLEDAWSSGRFKYLSSRNPDKGMVLQGQWEHWGNHRGLWYFDDTNLKSTLQGKEILEAQVYVYRHRAGIHSAQYPHFWYHNHSKGNSSVPSFYGGHQGKALAIDKGGWMSIPTSYVEKIRDGKATGLGVYQSDTKPYMKFHPDMKLWVKYK